MRHFLTQYYQLIPDWMGHLSENSYRLAFYLFYRARKAPIDENGSFRIKIDDIIHYIGLPTKEEVKNRNYDEAIIRPFNKAVEEIERARKAPLRRLPQPHGAQQVIEERKNEAEQKRREKAPRLLGERHAHGASTPEQAREQAAAA